MAIRTTTSRHSGSRSIPNIYIYIYIYINHIYLYIKDERGRRKEKREQKEEETLTMGSYKGFDSGDQALAQAWIDNGPFGEI